MPLRQRKPYTKRSSSEAKLVDTDIDFYINKLKELKNKDFLVKNKFDDIVNLLNSTELSNLKLCKLLYCTGHRKEVFLHLGTIVESKLNSIIHIYKNERWKTPNAFNNETALLVNFKDFLTKHTLNQKAIDLARFNLFNDFDTSERIKLKIQSFRYLRNYGGHSKSINEFFEAIIGTQEEFDSEIIDSVNLIRQLEIATNNLKANPPQDKY